MFDRNVVGVEFARICRAATEAVVWHLRDEFESSTSPDQEETAELVLLSKGLCYGLSEAYASVTARPLPMNLAATRRQSVSASSATIAVPYSNFDAGGSRLLIGDTVATGATVCSALRAYREKWEVGSVYLFSIAGSTTGAQAIARYCEASAIKLTMVFGLAAFGLADNGFDLAFQHPETIADARYVDRANAAFHGKPVSTVGWDFGSQMQAPRKYRQLCWLERRYWGLEGTDVFRDVEEPTDTNSLVEKEYSAFLSRRGTA